MYLPILLVASALFIAADAQKGSAELDPITFYKVSFNINIELSR